MKKFALSAAAASLALVGLAATLSPALADPGNGQGALVFNDVTCGIATPQADGGFALPIWPGEAQRVIGPSGNTLFVCRAEVSEAFRPAKAINLKNVLCNGLTGPGQGEVTLSPSGNLTGRCHINGSN